MKHPGYSLFLEDPETPILGPPAGTRLIPGHYARPIMLTGTETGSELFLVNILLLQGEQVACPRALTRSH
jgi:hypothetical protein